MVVVADVFCVYRYILKSQTTNVAHFYAVQKLIYVSWQLQ